jgi:alpha-N-acetylglucosaminidase
MIVLDSYAEVKPPWINSDLLYGVSYIWGMLHNFAADFKMYGLLDAVAAEQAAPVGLLPRPS